MAIKHHNISKAALAWLLAGIVLAYAVAVSALGAIGL
jgi:hypothetical protein